jgi:hypothetical protein
MESFEILSDEIRLELFEWSDDHKFENQKMKLVLCFTVLSSFLLLNDGFAVRSAVKCGNNRLKSTQLNLFGRKKAVADAVVQTTVTTGKQVAAGAAVSSAATWGNGGLCGILSSIKLKFMNIFTSLIGISLTY